MYQIKGKLRKNSRDYKKVIFETETETEVIDYLIRNNLKSIKSPYYFTHLLIEDNNQVIIQTCNNINCSPQKLQSKISNNLFFTTN